MTTQTHVATSDPFGIVSTFPARFHRAATSTINIDVISERIGLVLRAWDKFAAPVIDPAAQQVTEQAAAGVVDAPVVRPYPQSTVEAVEYLVDLLQISHDAVLRGTRSASARSMAGRRTRPQSRGKPVSVGCGRRSRPFPTSQVPIRTSRPGSMPHHRRRRRSRAATSTDCSSSRSSGSRRTRPTSACGTQPRPLFKRLRSAIPVTASMSPRTSLRTSPTTRASRGARR